MWNVCQSTANEGWEGHSKWHPSHKYCTVKYNRRQCTYTMQLASKIPKATKK